MASFKSLIVAILMCLATEALSFMPPLAGIVATGVAKDRDRPPLRNGSAVPGHSLARYNNDPGNDVFQIDRLDIDPSPCVIEKFCRVKIVGRFLKDLRNTTPHLSFNVTTHFEDGHTGDIEGEDNLCSWINVEQSDDDDLDGPEPEGEEGAFYPPAMPIYPPSIMHDQADRKTINNRLQFIPQTELRRRDDTDRNNSCPPRAGKAVIRQTWMLLGGWAPEANFSINVRASEEGGAGVGRRGPEGPVISDLRLDFPMRYRDDY